MASKSKNSIGLRELIDKVRQDLLTPSTQDGPALFTVDEVILEVNFVVTGDIQSGFDLGVVSLGSKVNEARVQKATIKLTPLATKAETRANVIQNGSGFAYPTNAGTPPYRPISSTGAVSARNSLEANQRDDEE